MQALLTQPVESFQWRNATVISPKTSLRQKLASKRKDVTLTQGEIGAKIGVKQGTVSLYERENERLQALGLDFAIKFFMAYGFNASEADMLAEELFHNVIEHFVRPGRGVTDKGPKVRLLGEIGAGLDTGLASDETILVSVPDWISERYNLDDVFAVDAVGSSMTCEIVLKTIKEGWRVFFHSKMKPQKGQIVACYLKNHDMNVMKVYMPEKHYVVLESFNPAYRSQPIIIDDSNPGTLQGVCLGWEARAPGVE